MHRAVASEVDQGKGRGRGREGEGEGKVQLNVKCFSNAFYKRNEGSVNKGIHCRYICVHQNYSQEIYTMKTTFAFEKNKFVFRIIRDVTDFIMHF